MDWLQFLQIICVPAFGWLFFKVGDVQKELNNFKVQVAKEYATQKAIDRIESKLDDIRSLVIEEIKKK